MVQGLGFRVFGLRVRLARTLLLRPEFRASGSLPFLSLEPRTLNPETLNTKPENLNPEP